MCVRSFRFQALVGCIVLFSTFKINLLNHAAALYFTKTGSATVLALCSALYVPASYVEQLSYPFLVCFFILETVPHYLALTALKPIEIHL